jgi:hypothetical protein
MMGVAHVCALHQGDRAVLEKELPEVGPKKVDLSKK